MNEKEKVINIALNEVGYKEKETNSNLDSKTTNAGDENFTKYARDLDNISGFYNGKKNGYDWCDIFVDWCFVKAFGVDRALKLLCQPKKSTGAGCGFSKNFYKNKGQLFDKPKVGDQIFFENSEGVYHTGIVYKVDNNKVYTIEGNTRKNNSGAYNEVCKKEYALNANHIGGYGRPKYKENTTTEEKAPEKKDTTVLEWQKMMNKVYNCGLAEDNSFGPDSRRKALKYYLYYKIPTIRGDRAEHVKFIQNRLCKHGYKVAVDGSFGPDSEAKTKQFQKAKGITVDGYVGADTTELLLK